MDMQERADKTRSVLDKHGNKFVQYIIPTDTGNRVFSFTIYEIMVIEYGGYDPFDLQWVHDIFKDMIQDSNHEGFEEMEREIIAAATTNKWTREENNV